MKQLTIGFLLLVLVVLIMSHSVAAQGAIIIDHRSTDITQVPQEFIEKAKTDLHIAYGHTSHGSQLTTGMAGLVTFANGGGLGLSLPPGIFAWNNGGTGGALDLEEGDGYGSGWMDHDCGYYPNWVNETREYLNHPSHADVNVIIWSWCGQMSGYTEQQMIDRYLAPMTQLEQEYPHVTFVYMTGHADGSGETGNLHLRNQQIRQYCLDNNKVLYDFYDIECYDPDGNYFGDKNVDDNCDYDSDGNGSLDANWAEEWQASHVEGVDWYQCDSNHSKPLNANRKAYAAWWLWAKLAGWNQACDLTAEFSANPTTGTAPLTVSFTDISTGAIDNWIWNFGDGQTATTSNPIHTYEQPGNYTVTLIVSNTNCSDRKVLNNGISVSGETPQSHSIFFPIKNKDGKISFIYLE